MSRARRAADFPLVAGRRAMVSVIGDGRADADSIAYRTARKLGRLLVDAGLRVVSGGLGGVMRAALCGARESERYHEGDTVAVLPTLRYEDANSFADIVIATGLGHLRNGIVANSDLLIVVGGGAGTLSEMCFAWNYQRPLIALEQAGGIGARYAGRMLDGEPRGAGADWNSVLSAASPEAAVQTALRLLRPPGDDTALKP